MNIQHRKADFLTAQAELDMARLWREKADLRARDQLLIAYLPLCRAVARRLSPNSQHHEDLFQDAMIGLMHALDRFEPDRGFRFGTYARWWVRSAVQEALVLRSADAAGMTGTQRKIMVLARRARFEATQAIRSAGLPESQESIQEEMARIIGVPVMAIADYEAACNALSLNMTICTAEGEPRELADYIPGPEPCGEGRVIASQMRVAQREILGELLSCLSEREADIVLRRHCRDGKGDTLDAIARDHKLSRERIRQIEHAAMKKLERHAKRKDIREKIQNIRA